MSRVDQLLKQHRKIKERHQVRTSFNLGGVEYEKFKEECKKRRLLPSELIDAFICDVNKTWETKKKKTKK